VGSRHVRLDSSRHAGRPAAPRGTRYLLPAGGGLTIELDVYRGDLAGLVTAEIEFESLQASRAFEAPAWLAEEVTDDPRYKNQSLAVHGLPR
jgi:adenylate cyclase